MRLMTAILVVWERGYWNETDDSHTGGLGMRLLE